MLMRVRPARLVPHLAIALVALLAATNDGAAQVTIPSQVLDTDSVPGSLFGLSIDIDGDTAVSSRQLRIANTLFLIQALVFEQDATTKRWNAVDPVEVGIRFGAPGIGLVSLDGDRLAVGIPSEATLGQGIGVVGIHERNGGGQGVWGQVDRVMSNMVGDRFGASVALDGDRLLVGAPDTRNGPRSGKAYLFERQQSGSWSQLAMLEPDLPMIGDEFGMWVALSGDTVVVSNFLTPEGRGYVFEPDVLGDWRQVATLDTPAGNQNIDSAVAIDGDRIVMTIGNLSGTETGIAIFERSPTDPENRWPMVATVLLKDADFGFAPVRLEGDTAVVGNPESGLVYVFTRLGPEPDGWTLASRFDVGGAPFDFFGAGVAFDGRRIAAGAPGAVTPTGQAHVVALPRFSTGFETGDTSRWTISVPAVP